MDAVRDAAVKDRRFSASQYYMCAVLALVYACHLVDRTIVMIVLEPIKHEFRLTDLQLGLFSGLAFAAGTLLAGLPLGALADRVSRKRLLAACITIWSGLTLICGLSTSYAMLLLSRFGVGMAEAGLQPTSLSMVSDSVRNEVRGKAIALVHLGLPLGTLIGSLSGGWIAQHYGWRMALFIVGAPGLLLAILVLLTLREPPREPPREPLQVNGDDEISYGAFFKNLAANRALLHVLAGATTLLLCTTSTSIWLAPFLMRSHGASIATVGVILAGTTGLGGIFGNLLAGQLSARIAAGRPDRLAAVSSVAALIYFALGVSALLAGDLRIVTLLLFLQMMAFFLIFTPALSLAMDITDSRTRGRTAAVLNVSAMFIGYGLGPQLSGALSDFFHAMVGEESLRYALLTMMGIMLWPATHFYLARRTLLQSV